MQLYENVLCERIKSIARVNGFLFSHSNFRPSTKSLSPYNTTVRDIEHKSFKTSENKLFFFFIIFNTFSFLTPKMDNILQIIANKRWTKIALKDCRTENVLWIKGWVNLTRNVANYYIFWHIRLKIIFIETRFYIIVFTTKKWFETS